jgi:hypothetical protein
MTAADLTATDEEKARLAAQINQKQGLPTYPAGQPILAADPPAIQAETASTPSISSGTESMATPKTWAESTYTITLGFQAADGSPEGRQVFISARRDDRAPKFGPAMREGVLHLPWQFQPLIQQLHPEDFTSEA